MASPRAQIWTTLAILGLTGALIGGHRLRTQLELGNPGLSTVSALSGPLATTQADGALPEAEAKYFYDLTQVMGMRYREPIKDPQVLGQGAVRGMIASLRHSDARYMDKDEFAAYQRQLKGNYEGAGLDLRFLVPDAIEKAVGDTVEDSEVMLLVPNLIVSDVLANGPAAQSGIPVGARIVKVDEKWLIGGEDVKKLRDLMEKSDKDPSAKTELDAYRAVMQDRVEHAMTPARAFKNLMTGRSGKITVRWNVDGGPETNTVIERGAVQVAPVERRGEVLVLRAITGASDALNRELHSNTITKIDLRSGMVYDPDEIQKILGLLGKGQIKLSLSNDKGFPVKEIVVNGKANGNAFELLVDKNMTGGLAILAKALAERGDVTLIGDLPRAPFNFVQAFRLADGTGYTLVTGLYPKPDTSATAKAEAKSE